MTRFLAIVCLVAVSACLYADAARTVEFTNRCNRDIWIAPLTNGGADKPPPPEGIQKLTVGATTTYTIPDSTGWSGRYWPKVGCDATGHNCEFGQSMAPCVGGCHPPADTKVEFHFPPLGNSDDVWYDVSLVDGYSLPAEIIPSNSGGSCRQTNCAVSLDACPQNDNDVGDLRVIIGGRTVACLSPCKKWNYPSPYGLGRDEMIEPGVHYCCPTPPIWPEQCSSGPVINTRYVELVRRTCPSAYSYAYDDHAGLHNCPTNTSFKVTFCQ